ncbi:hypothetical protein [Planomicrobium sp. Y74]|uniref:hypothetical protein n=1 Tax=Planomicrobium sp. Y74 TaxID=2478977 RepID=UPI000EF54E0F|nr:hypothetical protein [Planomicrobium sp. Y74]RLQ84941.1 hypothetical protein D9754_16900 [Planomicrobium sp. Y74]
MSIDEDLLKRIADHDKWAFEIIVDKYHILLWRVCWTRKSEDLLCEQLITQVFHQLWTHPEAFIGEKRLLFLLVECCKQKVTEADNQERDSMQ